jgi:hypothetical protein
MQFCLEVNTLRYEALVQVQQLYKLGQEIYLLLLLQEGVHPFEFSVVLLPAAPMQINT